jgi:hypothetical protein
MPKKDPFQNQKLDTMSILKALNHYNLHSSKKEAKKFLAEYLTEKGKTNFLLKDLKHLDDDDFQACTGYVARILVQGNSIPEISEENFNQQIDDIGYKIRKVKMELPEQPKKSDNAIIADPIIEYDEFAAQYGDIEFQIDVAIQQGCKNLDFEMNKWLQGFKIKPKDIKYMIDNLSAVRDEVMEAIEGHDKQLNEGYSHFDKPMKKRYVAMLDKWIQHCKEHTTSKRKPRKVKVKTPEQLTKNVKYMESCSDFSLVSILPEEIIGAKEVWLYNTKYKSLAYYYSPNGLSIKGTTIQDYGRSGNKKLRKPDIQLGEILSQYNFDDRMRWFGGIKTKSSQPNGRINTNIIIYKVFGS